MTFSFMLCTNYREPYLNQIHVLDMIISLSLSLSLSLLLAHASTCNHYLCVVRKTYVSYGKGYLQFRPHTSLVYIQCQVLRMVCILYLHVERGYADIVSVKCKMLQQLQLLKNSFPAQEQKLLHVFNHIFEKTSKH